MRRYEAIDKKNGRHDKNQTIQDLIREIHFSDREINQVIDLYAGERKEWKKDGLTIIRTR